VDTSLVLDVPGKFTASFFCSTDVDNNQIASFYTGAMANASELSFRGIGECDLTIVSPNDPAAMLQYVQECRTLGIPVIFDPGQQCARMSGPELREGVTGAAIVICNDYELELIRQKTSLGEQEILGQSEILVVTRGEHGCTILTSSDRTDVPAVAPRQIVDPTGVGDAFRAGEPSCAADGMIGYRAQLPHQWKHVGIKPRVEQHLGLDVLCLAMRFRLGEQAGKAAENLQEGRHGGVVERHVMLFS